MSEDRKPYIGRWDSTEPETLAETPVFTLRRTFATHPEDPSRRGEFVCIDSPDWVNIIAITPDGGVLLIEQFRHAVQEVTLEIPGGSVDAGEEPLAAGLRELREETGYVAAEARIIGAVAPNPAIINNRCHTVLATEVERHGAPAFDGLEEIRTRVVPLEEIHALMRSGAITHGLVVAAFHHLYLLETA